MAPAKFKRRPSFFMWVICNPRQKYIPTVFPVKMISPVCNPSQTYLTSKMHFPLYSQSKLSPLCNPVKNISPQKCISHCIPSQNYLPCVTQSNISHLKNAFPSVFPVKHISHYIPNQTYLTSEYSQPAITRAYFKYGARRLATNRPPTSVRLLAGWLAPPPHHSTAVHSIQ